MKEKYHEFTVKNQNDNYACRVNSDGSLTITDYIGNDVVIPSEIDGKSVTEIGDWAFAYCAGLTSITIPDSVMEIGKYAFAYCAGLTSITIPDSVMEIGCETFRNCDNITIRGFKNSYAETYANENKIDFTAIDNENN